MKRLLVLLLAVTGSLSAQPSSPGADYVYPSGADAPLNTKILVRAPFAQPASAVRLLSGSQSVPGRAERVPGAGHVWIVFMPSQPLLPRTTYTVSVAGSSSPSLTPYTATFTTGTAIDTTAPTVVSTSPANGEDSISTIRRVSIRFSEPLDPLSLNEAAPAIVTLPPAYPFNYPPQWFLEDAFTLVSFPETRFGMVYRVHFPGKPPQDLAGNTLAAAVDITFSTYPSTPKGGPQLVASLPQEGEQEVPTNSALFLRFDRPVPIPPDGALTLSSETDPNVALTVETITGVNALLVRPQLLLRGDQFYTLRSTRLPDSYGGQTNNSVLLRFRTRSLPELRTFQLLSFPRTPMPKVARLQWRYSRPLNPHFLPQFGRIASHPNSPPIQPNHVRLLADGATIEADVPGPGKYVLTGIVYDRVESKPLHTSGFAIDVQAVPDDRPPRPLAIFPSHPTAAATPEVSPVVVFDETIDPLAAGQIDLRKGDELMAFDVTVNDTTLSIRPRQRLAPGEYRVEVREPRDLAGNAALNLDWTFRVEEPAAGTEPFRLLQVEPADNTLNVDPRTPLVFTFNRPPNPVSVVSTYRTRVGSVTGPSSGNWRFEGNQAIFEPHVPFPSGSRMFWNLIEATDFAGRLINTAAGVFGVERARPEDGFRVTAVDPPPGQTGQSGDAAIRLDFSQPVDLSTLSNRNLALLSEGRVQSIQVAYDASRNQAKITTERLEGRFQVVAGSSILSQGGSKLEPFSAEVRLSPETIYNHPSEPKLGPFLRSTLSPAYPLPISPNSALVVFFNEPMQRNLVEQGLRVVVGSTVVTGRIEWIPDNRALTFFPTAPLPADADGAIVLSMVPWGGVGAESIQFSTEAIRPTPAAKWSLVGTFPAVPSDAVLDVEFDRDRPPGFVQSAIARGNGAEVTLSVTALSPRIYRFHAPRALTGGAWNIIVRTQDSQIESPSFTTWPFATPGSRQIDVGPTEAMGEAPVNAVVWLHSRTPLNSIQLKARLTVNGAPAPFTTEFLDAGFLVLLRPIGLLRAQTIYAVEVTGLEDLAGRKLPDRRWTFRTGPAADLVPAKLIDWGPKGVAPSSSALRATFDKPVFFLRTSLTSHPAESVDFVALIPDARVTGSISFSPDGRTLSYVPDQPWPINTAASVRLDGFYRDWTGTPIGVGILGHGNPSFRTPLEPVAALPRIEAVNPLRDDVDVPLNVEIQARFAQPVLESSLTKVRLESNGAIVPARALLGLDGRTVTLAPARILDRDRTYSAIIEGVRNDYGEAPEQRWNFHTGDSLTLGPTEARAIPNYDDRMSFRAEMARPWNPLSVDPTAFELRLNGVRVGVEIRTEASRRSIIVRPVQALPEGANISLSATGLRDWAGNPVTLSGGFTARRQPADTSAPAVQMLMPGDGSTAKRNTIAAVAMDESFHLRYGTDGVRLRSGDRELRAYVEQPNSGKVLMVRPMEGWVPGESYTIEASGIVDIHGNEAPPVRWSFQISQDPTVDNFVVHLVSTTPRSGAVGVPIDTPIEFEYSKPVIIMDSYLSPSLSISGDGVYLDLKHLLRPSHRGATVRLTEDPLPAGSRIQAQVTVQDQGGFGRSLSFTFSTAAVPDSTPPTLESIVPPPRTKLDAGRVEFLLRFSEPVLLMGEWAQFSSSGIARPATQATYPVQGDGRTIRVTLEVPGDAAGTLGILSNVVDLSGNRFVPAVFEYSTGPEEDAGSLRVRSIQPSGSSEVPPDTAIEVQFNQAVNAASLTAALRIYNDGSVIPATPTSSDGKTWQITPGSPWRAGSTVTVTVGTLVFGISRGAVLESTFSSTFRIRGAGVNNTSSNTLAAIDSSPEAVNLRFAEPRSLPPAEPFGLRSGQQRISARIERIGEASFRLVPDTPLQPQQKYFLMAGPGIEIPLHISKEGGPETERRQTAPEALQGADGSIRLLLSEEFHRFSIDRESLAVTDEDGRALPYEALLTSDGKVLLIDLYGSSVAARIVLFGRSMPVKRAKGR